MSSISVMISAPHPGHMFSIYIVGDLLGPCFVLTFNSLKAFLVENAATLIPRSDVCVYLLNVRFIYS